MPGRLFKKLRDILFPEAKDGSDNYALAPVEVVESTYRRILQLADQIRAHAEQAPYPHIAEALRRVAAENQAQAEELQQRLRNLGVWVPRRAMLSVSGKNHWERMTLDLKNQKSLDDFLQIQQARLAVEDAEIARLLGELRTRQTPHKELLMTLVAVADPQATQT